MSCAKKKRIRVRVIQLPEKKAVAKLPICLEVEQAGSAPYMKLLSTNAAGYVSFLVDTTQTNENDNARIFPYETPELGRDINLREGWSEFQIFEIHLTKDELPEHYQHIFPALPAVELPDSFDYQILGEELAVVPNGGIGKGNCKKLIPNAKLKRHFGLQQLAFTDTIGTATLNGDGKLYCDTNAKPEADIQQRPAIPIREGEVLEFKVDWTFLGHSLGELINSFSLAPCEVVRFANIDWMRTEGLNRQEEVLSGEQMIYDNRQDRLIDETMDYTLRERSFGYNYQNQSSVTIPIKGVPLNISSVGKVSGQASRRNLAINSSQSINDRISQSASFVRGQRTALVVETTQRENESIHTRAIKNHNKCHTLNLWYYEMIRHYEVVTYYCGKRNILFIKYCVEELTPEKVAANAHLLRLALLDHELDHCFEMLQEAVFCCDKANNSSTGSSSSTGEGVSGTAAILSNKIRVRIKIGSDKPGTNGVIKVNLKLNSGSVITVTFPKTGNWSSNTTYTETIILPTNITPADVVQVGLSFSSSGLNNDFKMHELVIQYEHLGTGSYYLLYENIMLNNTRVQENAAWWATASPTLPDAPKQDELVNPIPPGTEDKSDCEKAKCCLSILMNHIKTHEVYYNSILWLNEDSVKRAARLDNYLYNGSSLLSQISNQPIGVYGSWVAFLKNDALLDTSEIIPEEKTIAYLPSRGTYLEAILGQCSSCEIVDPKSNEYRDWQCEDLTPKIADIEAVKPTNNTSLVSINPTALPTAVLGYQNMPELPKPSMLESLGSILEHSSFNDLTKLEDISKILEQLIKALKDAKDDDDKDDDDDGGNDDNGGDDDDLIADGNS